MNILQQEAAIWQEDNFGVRPAYEMLLGLGEETGELLHCELKALQGIRGSYTELKEKAGDAVADMVIYLIQFLTLSGISIEEVESRIFPKGHRVEMLPTTFLTALKLFYLVSQVMRAGSKAHIRHETSYLLALLKYYCELKELNFDDEIEKAWNTVKQRNWKRNPKNGSTESSASASN